MSNDGHDEFAAAAIERTLDPGPLAFVDGAQDAGVDREQCEIFGLQFKEHRPLVTGVDAIEPSQTRGFGHEPVDAARIGAGQPKVDASTRASIAARAALGSRKFALNPSSASNQS